MKLVFFGTPDFAVPTLDALHNSSHEILGVVTSPDKKSGRGLKVKSSAIKKVQKSMACLFINRKGQEVNNYILY